MILNMLKQAAKSAACFVLCFQFVALVCELRIINSQLSISPVN